MELGMWTELAMGFDAALERIPDALKAEGFGILTQIDVKETLKAKLGVEFARYRILGACNPTLAHEALTRDRRVGVLLPCNVVLYETAEGKTVLGAVDPIETIGARSAEFRDLAGLVRGKLERVLAAMAAS